VGLVSPSLIPLSIPKQITKTLPNQQSLIQKKLFKKKESEEKKVKRSPLWGE
jgi:hypothetical protein